ncbi:hypothetical protein KP509_01G064100 [Ceratopteris richardii]|uniref:Pentatricopeptide repeat-containing protein n=1 Tax=Ceratopteris richardii TaxID=49495 RepID=A0A8T2VDS2_CERRI|nr:hypothetical protein KP509_01G064100 [Ceratopteris richardii]
MYAKCGMLENAQKTFDELAVQNVVSWTALITGYAQNGSGEKALYCFEQMRRDGLSPNESTFSCILKACGAVGDFWKGCEVHVEIMKVALLERDIVIANALVDMYAKCGDMVKAQTVFNELSVPDVVSWSTLISGYAQHLHYEQVLCCFEQMLQEGFAPNVVTFLRVLKACAGEGTVHKGQELHSEIARTGHLQNDVMIGAALIDMYAKCGVIARAMEIFSRIQTRGVISWNAIIAGYADQGLDNEVLKCFECMQTSGVCPDEVTFVYILKACGSIKALEKGEELHDLIIRVGMLENDSFVATALVNMYFDLGMLVEAQIVHGMSVRDEVSWNVLISGFIYHRLDDMTLQSYKQMLQEGFAPNVVTFLRVLKACAGEGTVHKGQELHSEIARIGHLQNDVMIGASLIDMYAKCGMLENAQKTFDELAVQNVVSWTALITGYAQNGSGEKALYCFEQMRRDGLSPNESTFSCILKACGVVGDFWKGCEVHVEIMKVALLERDIVIANALVDMYAKCGDMVKAQTVFNELFVPDVVSWSTLISGYAQHLQYEQVLCCFECMKRGGGSLKIL